MLVDAPLAAAGHEEIKEDETVENGQLAPVELRKEASRRVRVKVSDRHVAGEDEGDRPGEQADQVRMPPTSSKIP